MSRKQRHRPGPRDYAIDTLVEVKLTQPSKERIYFTARVIKHSLTYLRVSVVGTGSEITLTRWDVRLFVRRPGEDYERDVGVANATH